MNTQKVATIKNGENKKKDKLFFGQPWGVFGAFATEMWERFSFYGMKAIMVFYMMALATDPNSGLGLNEHTALSLMSIYGSLIMLSPIVGGWLADRVLGASKTIVIGGVLIIMGQLFLAMPFNSFYLLLAAMLFIMLGTGCLKGNISNVVGQFYTKDDPRRDAGFSLFYMGINIGSFASPLITGFVGQNVSYHIGFSIPAIGMVIGLFIFLNQKKRHFPEIGNSPPVPLEKGKAKKFLLACGSLLFLIFVIVSVLVSMGILSLNSIIDIIGVLTLALPVVYIARMLLSGIVTKHEKRRVISFIPLFIFSIIFWVIQESVATVFPVFLQQNVNRNVFGIDIPASTSISVFSSFVILLAPLFSRIWMKMGKRQPTTVVKFGFGLAFAGLSYVVISIAIMGAHGVGISSYYVSFFWILLAAFMLGIGEVCLSPVGLSATTVLAPKAFKAQALAIWFMSDSAGQAINALISPFYTSGNEAYYFGTIGFIALLFSAVAFGLKKPMDRLLD
jgi:POT family proton-dependent oligopeptide transporter